MIYCTRIFSEHTYRLRVWKSPLSRFIQQIGSTLFAAGFRNCQNYFIKLKTVLTSRFAISAFSETNGKNTKIVRIRVQFLESHCPQNINF